MLPSIPVAYNVTSTYGGNIGADFTESYIGQWKNQNLNEDDVYSFESASNSRFDGQSNYVLKMNGDMDHIDIGPGG